ncbi:MAG: beta-glucosidase [Gammaproteobacteria bacterium]|nr:beta-glucosidase [Gammaproteobacteria bacterium]MBA4729876.1 glycoside hydrolase family 3 C-terminal domain-containing protein [SAR86 cluster bacterium]RPG34774.1 MAG: glycoside hydrolase family 3 protein [Gammaproteobacteria bacterium TMED193]|tara:strand:+ start:172 stop:2106 length:1935 start_codon:yes stop_codon:yes gene_type:complete
MKKFTLYLLIFALLVLILWALNIFLKPVSHAKVLMSSNGEVETIIEENKSFRDLNKNGKLDIYEDSRQPVSARVEDLLSQMTIEEKVGQMFHPPVLIKPDILFRSFLDAMNGGITEDEFIASKHISHFNFYGEAAPIEIAERLNALQKVAEETRLGIPVTFSTDPLHEVPRGGGIAAFSLDGISKWPSQLGFAATRDPKLIFEFGQIASAEYRAMGFRTGLHPMSDLATEPRWARNFGTFGSNADLSSEMTVAYVKGFQGNEINENSVHTMVKHFPGGGPQEGGLDPHLKSGENQVYPGNNFDYHLKPFQAAIDSGMKVVMPYYGIPVGQTDEDVAMAFNKYILTDLLREKMNFEGVICTDWGVIEGRHWGVDNLSIIDRYEKSINAGVDQYGGENKPEYVVELVKNGKVTESRIDESVRRILKNKFELGLFEQPFVEESNVQKLVNKKEYIELGLEAQRKSIVLLSNKNNTLPLKKNIKVFVDGMDELEVSKFADIVNDHREADFVLLFLNTVFNGNQPSGIDRVLDNMLSTMFPNMDLNYNQEISAKIEKYSSDSKLIVISDLNRPAILNEANEKSLGLIGTFGVQDRVILETVFGDNNPTGKLPFEMPSSMEEVLDQNPDVPDDTANPIFSFGHGLSYQTE